MRVLVTIPHYANPGAINAADGRTYASLAQDKAVRVRALTACLTALRAHFGGTQAALDHENRGARLIQPAVPCTLDIVVCTTQGRHLLAELADPGTNFEHREITAEPLLLGFECHAVLRERLGDYDYYCYLEDDLIVHDPWLFVKLHWFTEQFGDSRLLQPHRYEAGLGGTVRKVYIDGHLRQAVTAGLIDWSKDQHFEAEALGLTVAFEKPTNPHAGCFFLNVRQMTHWVKQPHFLDRHSRLIGPLESAATLGIARTFAVYKPALTHAAFFEVEHFGQGYQRRISALAPT